MTKILMTKVGQDPNLKRNKECFADSNQCTIISYDLESDPMVIDMEAKCLQDGEIVDIERQETFDKSEWDATVMVP